jgi:hypothetical protein
MLVPMADLEEHALRRDRGFLVRLVLTLGAGLVFGLFIFAGLTGEGTVGCAARTIGGEAAQAE